MSRVVIPSLDELLADLTNAQIRNSVSPKKALFTPAEVRAFVEYCVQALQATPEELRTTVTATWVRATRKNGRTGAWLYLRGGQVSAGANRTEGRPLSKGTPAAIWIRSRWRNPVDDMLVDELVASGLWEPGEYLHGSGPDPGPSEYYFVGAPAPYDTGVTHTASGRA